MCDAVACQKIYSYIETNYDITKRDVQQYHFNDNYVKKADKPTLVKSLNSLYGIVTGIVADKVINDMELQRIETWINEYKCFCDSYPYTFISPKIQNIISDKIISTKEKEILMNLVEKYMPENTFSDATLSMQVLMGILEGITCDKMINVLELDSLQQWINDNMHLKGNYPFDTILTTINKVLEDGIVTTDESNELVELFNHFINPIEKKSNFCSELSGKKICLTGNFVNGTKDDIGELVVKHGGEISSGVTRNTNIVLVGGEGSKDWSYGNFGTKVKKAMELKSKGFDIEILSEEDFLNLIRIDNTA